MLPPLLAYGAGMSGLSLGAPTTVGGSQSTGSAANAAPGIAEFLRRVLPSPVGQGRAIGIHYARRSLLADGSTSKDDPIPGRAFYDVDSAARYAAGYLRQMQASSTGVTADLYTCMSLCGMEVMQQPKTGAPRLMNTRNRQAMVACKALWADLDVKDKGYPDQQTALAHIDSLVQAGKIPAPTVKVSSGNGVHLHWVLDRALNQTEWYALGPAWSQYLTGLKVKHDKIVSSDAVRVLRLPETFNIKDIKNPLPTAIIGAIDPTDIPVVVFEQLLGVNVAHSVVPISGQALSPIQVAAQNHQGNHQLPAAFNNVLPFAPLDPSKPSEFSAGIDPAEHVGQPVDFAKVVANCPTLKDIHARGGAGDTGFLWGLALLAATFAPSTDARQWAHDFSNRHAQYTPADTDAKFDQKMAARTTSGGRIGWPSCKTFSANSPACATCPKLGLGKTPFHGARDDSDMPEGYFRKQGEIHTTIQDDDGNQKEFTVLAYGILDAYMETTPAGPVLNCEIVHIKNPPKRLVLSVGAATSWRDAALGALGAVGIALLPHQIPLARNFFVSYIQHLQKRVADVAARDGYGWTKLRNGDVGFAFGGRVYGPNGTSELAPPVDRVLSARFRTEGDVGAWKQAADLVMGMGRIDLQAIVAASFAAPLVYFSGQSGVMFSAYSPESGVQKSTAMKVAASVWCDPVGGMSRLDDTVNHVGKKLGQLRHLPIFWDELHHKAEAEQFAKLGFALTLGTEKGRLGQNADMKESGSWATMLIVASNPGVRQVMLEGTAGNSAAGVNRLLEVEVQKVPLTSSAAQASSVIDLTHHNFGLAGALYAELLAEEAPNLKARLIQVSESLEKSTNAKPDERFWILGAASILLGAALANTIRNGALIQFDLKALHAFLVGAITRQRAARAQDVHDFDSEDFAVSVVQGYIDYCRVKNACLETDTAPTGAGRPKPVELRMMPDAARMLKAPHLHILQDDSLIRFTKNEFRAWLMTEKKLPMEMVRKALTRFGNLSEVRARWAAGTAWTGASQTFYQIDVNPQHTGLGQRFNIGPVVGPVSTATTPGGGVV